MEISIKVEKIVEIKTLEVKANVRYWEDATINGQSNEDGSLVPFKNGELWCPIIDIETGVIKDWPVGTIADIHFKVCDDGSYYLKDENDSIVLSIEKNYVPSIMCTEGNGWGDYIIMKINENGAIQNWQPNISDFQ